jgi:hypothetical protein
MAFASPTRAEQPAVRELRTQVVGGVTYFHVRLEPPRDMDGAPADEPAAAILARGPRLVPQDGKTWAVYHRLAIPEAAKEAAKKPHDAKPPGGPPPQPAPAVPAPPEPVPIRGLEFVGKAGGPAKARFVLFYPVSKEDNKPAGKPLPGAKPQPATSWVETPVVLGLAEGKKIAVPETAAKRRPQQALSADDLEGLWAVAQAARFAVLESQANDFGFYTFAREATGRKYGVPAPALGTSRGAAVPGLLDQQLFETTTGAAVIMESLQRQRMLGSSGRDSGERSPKVEAIPSIQLAEQPWKKKRRGKKPAVEPLARLVPADNYYLCFRDVGQMLELAELMEQWGGELQRVYEVTSRAAGLRRRYERQLCLRSGALGRLLGPQVIQAVALTGSDPYLREGSDVAVLFQARNPKLLLAGLEPFLDEARKEWKDRLRQGKEEYQGISIESFVTPHREVSLYRATAGDVLVYANSPVGMRRVLDSFRGRLARLADAADFHYARTQFPSDDPAEDGFLYLSEAFIRQLAGPASKIKEKRRLEALTSLAMVTNGALFTAWENARPGRQQQPAFPSGLKKEELYAPGGQDVAWDPARQMALSDLYNTLHFATPLIEIPIDRVTEKEEQSYQQFRQQYQGPNSVAPGLVAMRFTVKSSQVQVQAFLLPLLKSKEYQDLEQEIGGGTTTVAPDEIPANTLVQLKTHFNPKGESTRAELTAMASILGGAVSFDCLGDWALVRLEDSPVYEKMLEVLNSEDLSSPLDIDPRKTFDLLFQIPITVGVEVRNRLTLAALLGTLRATVLAALPGEITWGPLEQPYRGVSIVRIAERPDGVGPRGPDPGDIGKLVDELRKLRKDASPALYYALVDRALYISTTEGCIKGQIDASMARREKKAPEGRAEPVPVHSSLYLAPGAAVKAEGLLRLFLESQVQEQALANEPLLYLLYHAGLVGKEATEDEVRTAAMQYFGFVPVSPDGAVYTYSPAGDEVRNRRHGSLGQPQSHRDLEKGSPTSRLLEQLRSLRADLRFQDDGIFTGLTLTRKKPAR